MVEKLGEVQGVDVYYDQYQENNKFLMVYKEGKLKSVIGNTRDLKKYETALENYENTTHTQI